MAESKPGEMVQLNVQGKPVKFDTVDQLTVQNNEGGAFLLLNGWDDFVTHVGKHELHVVEKNRETEIRNDEKVTVVGNRLDRVLKDETIVVLGNRSEQVIKDETIAVQGNRTTTILKDDEIAIKGSRDQKVDLDEVLVVGMDRGVQVNAGHDVLKVLMGHQEVQVNSGNSTLNVLLGSRHVAAPGGTYQVKAMNVAITATNEIVLNVGENQIRIDATGVTILGALVKIN